MIHDPHFFEWLFEYLSGEADRMIRREQRLSGLLMSIRHKASIELIMEKKAAGTRLTIDEMRIIKHLLM